MSIVTTDFFKKFSHPIKSANNKVSFRGVGILPTTWESHKAVIQSFIPYLWDYHALKGPQ